MARRNVSVFAPAPIPIGQEIEVQLTSKGVAVRDLTTGILYGIGGVFSLAKIEDNVDGGRSDFRSSQLATHAKVESAYRGRVMECVIANISQHEGVAACTSFVVEVAATPPGPYRG